MTARISPRIHALVDVPKALFAAEAAREVSHEWLGAWGFMLPQVQVASYGYLAANSAYVHALDGWKIIMLLEGSYA
jgi:hypothetical protein